MSPGCRWWCQPEPFVVPRDFSGVLRAFFGTSHAVGGRRVTPSKNIKIRHCERFYTDVEVG